MRSVRRAMYIIVITVFLYSCSKDDKVPEPVIVQNDIAAINTQITAFMTKYNVPGASLAISKNGKLVYRKGYGDADKAGNEKVTVDHRFRLASVSKTITATAIMKLMQEGKLSLSQKVFGTGAVLGTRFGTAPYSSFVSNVTVKDLLQHTSGGWNNAYPGDPCYTNPEMSAEQLISWTLNNRPLTNAPGTTYQYSNFGYLVLARIIEKVSGKTYENYIKQDILAPAGATKTELAGNTEAERKPNEVKYYGQGAEAANVYTDPWKRNDGPAGWISTPTDLLRFLTAIDSSSTRPDILTGATLTVMRTGSAVNKLAACGIVVEDDPSVGSIWYHSGSLPGSQSLIFRTKTGFCVAFVVNSRYTNQAESSNAMAQMLLGIILDNTIPWQDIDQF